MSAVRHAPAAPALRLVPPVDAADAAVPASRDLRGRIKNTLRCQRDLVPGSPCGVPLLYRTKGGDYLLAEFVKQATYDQVGGEPCRHVTCPNCGTVRTVILR